MGEYLLVNRFLCRHKQSQMELLHLLVCHTLLGQGRVVLNLLRLYKVLPLSFVDIHQSETSEEALEGRAPEAIAN